MSKSMVRIVASAFHANIVTEGSVKSRKSTQALAIDVNIADRVSDSGGGS